MHRPSIHNRGAEQSPVVVHPHVALAGSHGGFPPELLLLLLLLLLVVSPLLLLLLLLLLVSPLLLLLLTDGSAGLQPFESHQAQFCPFSSHLYSELPLEHPT